MEPARKQELFRLQHRLFDPLLQGVSGGLCNFELHRTLSLALQDAGADGHLISMTHVPDFEDHKVACAQFAVDA